MNSEDMVFVGIKRQVLALDRRTGQTLWATLLNDSMLGDGFVNLLVDGDSIVAHTKGELYCLDAADGRIKWNNPLTGCGYGIATLASAAGTSGNGAAIRQKIQQDEAAASSAASTGASAS